MFNGRTLNDQVERRGNAVQRTEADLSRSSTHALAHRRCFPRSLQPLARSDLAVALNAYTINIDMTQDPAKRQSNKRKHKIDLVECEAAFDAPTLTREDASQGYGEQRLISLGW